VKSNREVLAERRLIAEDCELTDEGWFWVDHYLGPESDPEHCYSELKAILWELSA
jgi:6-phosphogluconolactonase/glucosamine-6-phosphate isomerase/deaminase